VNPTLLWLGTLVLASAALAYSLRDAPLGIPVADDYAFLDRLKFQRPLDPFDSMGGAFYWRPLGRQAYFAAIGPFLFTAPWIVPLVHGAALVLVSLLLARIGRRLGWSAPACALVAVAPLLAESTRVLFTWPSGAQHLLAMLFAVLALHESVHGRAWRAAGAVFLGVLAHESCALVLPVLPLLATGPRRALPALAVLAGWQAGYMIARGHGVVLPSAGGDLAGHALDAIRLGVIATLDLEDAAGMLRSGLMLGYGLILLAAVATAAFGTKARQRAQRAAPALLVALAVYAVGTLPLAALLPDWNAWRSTVPGLALAAALTAFAALAAPEIGAAFVVLRAVALLGAAPATTRIDTSPPVTTSDMSFVRLTRLQAVADASRRAVLADLVDSKAPIEIRTVHSPRMAEVAFQGSRALRVWLGDSTAIWKSLGGDQGLREARGPVVAYDLDTTAWQAVLLQPRALRLLVAGIDAAMGRRFVEAESLLIASQHAQPRASRTFQSFVDANLARTTFFQGRIARAESLNESSRRLASDDTNYWALRAAIELGRGDRAAAIGSARRSLADMPGNPFAQAVLDEASR